MLLDLPHKPLRHVFFRHENPATLCSSFKCRLQVRRKKSVALSLARNYRLQPERLLITDYRYNPEVLQEYDAHPFMALLRPVLQKNVSIHNHNLLHRHGVQPRLYDSPYSRKHPWCVYHIESA